MWNELADNGPVGYFLCALMIEIDITAAGTHDRYHGSWRRLIQPSLLCPFWVHMQSLHRLRKTGILAFWKA